MPVPKPWLEWGLPAPKSEASTGEISLVDYEVYSGIEVHDWPFFVRLDGWSFHALTKRMRLEKPFDRRLSELLSESAESFFVPFNPVLCYIFSDEVNFLFLQPNVFQRVEKIDSVFAGLLSARFTQLAKTTGSFDCRVIPVGRKRILNYLIWRQAECWRNHNNAWAQWTLTERAGLSPSSANSRLMGLKVPEIYKLCKKYRVDLRRTPAWQQRGLLLYSESYRKVGYNPISRKRVVVKRRRVKIDWSPPAFRTREGRSFLRSLLSA